MMKLICNMNVAVISNLIGRWSGFNENDLNLLTLSALLHDIGKTAMPQSILKSPTTYGGAVQDYSDPYNKGI